MKMRNVETITHTSFSLKLFVCYIITKTVWFYNYMYIQFSKASIMRNTASVNWFPSLNFRHPLKSKGCLKFIQRFPWIDFHHFSHQLIKITWLLTMFIDFDFYLLATLGFNYIWYTCQVSCLRRDCHAWGSKTWISHLLMPVFRFVMPGRKVWAITALTDTFWKIY